MGRPAKTTSGPGPHLDTVLAQAGGAALGAGMPRRAAPRITSTRAGASLMSEPTGGGAGSAGALLEARSDTAFQLLREGAGVSRRSQPKAKEKCASFRGNERGREW